jgi:four helix bundle protein
MSTPIRTHRELLIWQRGMTLVDAVDEMVKRLPDQERFMLADQLVRATRSVPTNIAEGHGRFTPGDFARFLTIAHGSLSELDTHLEIARRRGYLEQTEWATLNEAIQELARMIRAFRAALRRR